MKRLFSWIVLSCLVGSVRVALFYILRGITLAILGFASGSLDNQKEYTLMIIVLFVIIGGFTLALLHQVVFRTIANKIVNIVQSIHPSKSGLRYIVLAIESVLSIVYLFRNPPTFLLIQLPNPTETIIGNCAILVILIIITLFTIKVAIIGKSKANEEKEKEFKEKVEEYVRNMK